MEKVCLLTTCCLLISTHAADMFTSLVHLHQSIQAEIDIVHHINAYIVAEQHRLEQLGR